MTEGSATGRAGTPDEVASVGALLIGPDGGLEGWPASVALVEKLPKSSGRGGQVTSGP